MLRRIIFVLLLGSAVAQVTNPTTSSSNITASSVNLTGSPGCLVSGVACSSQNLLSDAALIVRSNSPVTYSVADTFGTSGFLFSGTGTGTTTVLGPATAGAFNLLWPAITANSNLLADTTITAHTLSVPLPCVAASASGSAYTCSTTPTFVPADHDLIIFEADVASAGATTLVVNGQAGTPAIQKGGASATATVANDLRAGGDYLFEFDGANWQALGQLGGPIPMALGGTGITSCAAGTLLTGGANFTCPTTFTITTGVISKYNNIATAGQGTPAILAAVNSASQTAAISTATLCAAATCGNGTASQYHLHFDFWGAGTACSSVTAGSVTFLLTWTDENAVTHAAVALQMMGQTGAATMAMGGTFPFQTALANESASGDFTFSTNGTIIQYATGYTACTTGTGTYSLRTAVTRLQ